MSAMLSRSLYRVSRRACTSNVLRIHRSSFRTQPLTAQRCMHISRPVLATPPPMVNHSELTTERYHQLSDATMDTLLESLETILDELGNVSYEVEYSSGVLTLSLADNGTYVINKQPPNKQIWLSSPFSGPKRYDYVAESDGWYYSRDGRSLENLLDDELSKIFGKDVRLGVAQVSTKVA